MNMLASDKLTPDLVKRAIRALKEDDRMAIHMNDVPPHRLTERAMARMAVRHGVNGERYVDPAIVAALAHHGYDPEPYVKHLLQLADEDDA